MEEQKQTVEEPEQESPYPEWAKVSEEQVKVKTKDGVFVLEDVPYDKVMRAKQRVTRGRDDPAAMDKFEMALISESLVGENKKGELELTKLRTSTVMRLKYAVTQLYDLQSFL